MKLEKQEKNKSQVSWKKKKNNKDYRRNQWNCEKGNQWGGGQAINKKL